MHAKEELHKGPTLVNREDQILYVKETMPAREPHKPDIIRRCTIIVRVVVWPMLRKHA